MSSSCIIRKVEFTKTENKNINIAYYEKDEIIKQLTLNVKELRCEDGGIVLREEESAEDISPVLPIKYINKNVLFSADDGSLVVESYGTGARNATKCPVSSIISTISKNFCKSLPLG